MKKFFALLILVLFLLGGCLNVAAQEYFPIKVIMVDKNLNFEYLECEVNPIIVNGYTLVPVRAIAEKLSYNVEWDSNSKLITITNGTDSIKMTIGSTSVIVNSQNSTMPIAPQIVNGRTLIPLRFVSECFDKKVIWKSGLGVNLIWISSLDLLNDSDVNVPYDTNFYVLSKYPTPYYELRDDGVTSRGIRIGDDYEKVISAYGQPHKTTIKNGEIVGVDYLTPYLPNTGSGSTLSFYFKDSKVESVNIDPPV